MKPIYFVSRRFLLSPTMTGLNGNALTSYVYNNTEFHGALTSTNSSPYTDFRIVWT